LLYPALYCIFAAVSAAAAIFCVFLYFKRWKRRDIVYDNNAFFVIVISIPCLSAIIFYLVWRGDWQLSLIPSVLCFLFLMGLASWHNEIVIFDENGFTLRNFFYRSTRYSYFDLTGCTEHTLKHMNKRREMHTVFHIGKKRFTLSRKAVNYDDFALSVRQHGPKGLRP